MAVQRTVVCLAVATTLFGSFCCLLLGILIWRERVVHRPINPAADRTIQSVDNATWIRTTFPGYFRTPREQEALETAMESGGFEMQPVSNVSMRFQRCLYQQPCPLTGRPSNPYRTYRPLTPGPYEPKPGPSPANGSRARDSSPRRRRQVGASPGNCSLDDMDDDNLRFHACCMSYVFFANPDYLPAPDVPGTPLQIAQLRPMNLLQFFQMARCCQASSCSVCQCNRAFYTTSAVVVDPPNSGKLQVKLVRVPGCCQCLNSGGS